MTDYMTPERYAEHWRTVDACFTSHAMLRGGRIDTKSTDDPYRGEYDCGDCCSMSHCETHHKDVGTYPFDERAVYGGKLDETLDRWPRVEALAATVLGRVAFPERRR